MKDYLYTKTEGCKDCKNAKSAFVMSHRVGFRNIGVMCLSCDAIWKLEDDDND